MRDRFDNTSHSYQTRADKQTGNRNRVGGRGANFAEAPNYADKAPNKKPMRPGVQFKDRKF